MDCMRKGTGGICEGVPDLDARGKRAIETSEGEQKLQAVGLRKLEVLRLQGVSRSIVDWY